jgi:hypothetical protein
VTPRRIVVSGMIASDPNQGGASWAVLQYVLGLRRLGHHVTLVEPVDELTMERVSSFKATTTRFGLTQAASLLQSHSRATAGSSFEHVLDECSRADLLINVSGMLRAEELVESIPVRVYLDLDPAFNQLWATADGIDVGFANHTHFVTVGQRVGTAGCEVPTCGRKWIHSLPPVVLERWPYAAKTRHRAFTTVGNWRAYGSIEVGGRRYGQKAHSMRRLMQIPSSSAHHFAVALSIHPDEESDLAALRANGWRLLDPATAAGTTSAYRGFIQTSFAEIGIAKSGYVDSNCGWFSDRSACYLASGRPVLAQDTGFSVSIPTGNGLLAFRDVDEACEAADIVCSRYEHHRRAARQVAEEFFDSDLVLGRILEEVGAA